MPACCACPPAGGRQGSTDRVARSPVEQNTSGLGLLHLEQRRGRFSNVEPGSAVGPVLPGLTAASHRNGTCDLTDFYGFDLDDVAIQSPADACGALGFLRGIRTGFAIGLVL